MVKVCAFPNSPSLGALARRIRTSQCMSQEELADITGVSPEQVDLFEHSLPVPLDIRRRLLKELWARKNGR